MSSKKNDFQHQRLLKKLNDIQEIDDFKSASKGMLKTKAILDICSNDDEDLDHRHFSFRRKRKM